MARTLLPSLLFAILTLTPTVLAQQRVDALGDPLPEGAIARVGTTRMRHFSLPEKLCFGIGCIAWSPDGSTIATTSFASGRVGVQARLWEASTGKPLPPLQNNESYGPSFVRFSPDSKTLAATAGNKIVLWDVSNGKETGQLIGHRADVDCLAFQDGGKTIVSVGGDGTIHWWEVVGRKEIRVWQTLAKEPKANDKGEPFEMHLSNACFSSDGKSLAVEKWWTADKGFRRSGNTMALVFDLEARKELWREDTGGFGCSFAFASDGKRLAMAGKDREFSVREVGTGRRLTAGPSTGFMPFGLAFAPDGKSVAIHWFGGLVFWSLEDKKTPLRHIKSTFEMRLDSGTVPTFSPDGKRLVVSTSVSTHMSFRVLDVASAKPAVYWPSNDMGWGRMQFTADGRTLLTANGLKLAGIDTASWKVKWEVDDPPRKVRFNLPKVENVKDLDKILELWADDPDFRAANSDHSLCVAKKGKHPNALLDMKTGKVLAQLDRPETGLECCDGFFSPRSTLYIMRDWNSRSDQDGKFREINTIFAIPSGKRLCRLASENSNSEWSFSADESRVASFVRETGVLQVHDTATGKLIRQMGAANPKWAWIYATLALSPDGNKLAAWTNDLRHVEIWDVETGKHHRRLTLPKIDKGHVAACLAWSPDNRMLAVGGLDNSVRLWEVASAQVRREYVGHLVHARLLAFSPDGTLLVSASDDTTMLIWNTHLK
jgi:WD40 repeat protein